MKNRLLLAVGVIIPFIMLFLPGKSMAQLNGKSDNREVPFSIVDGGLILMECTIDDNVNGKFGFDTGGGIHIISESLAEKIKAKHIKRFSCFQAHGERVDVETYAINTISIGGCRQSNPIVTTFPGLEQMGIDGILSLKLFQDQPFTLDFLNNTIILEDQESLETKMAEGETVPLKLQVYRDYAVDVFADFLIINDKGESRVVELEIDTGRGYETKLDSRFMEFFDICKDSVKQRKMAFNTDPDKTFNLYYSKIESLSVNNVSAVEVIDPEVIFQDNLIYDGLIGIGIWKNRKLTIDMPGKRLIVN